MNAWNITITKALIEEAKILFHKEISKTHEKAYEKWSSEDDKNLEKMFCKGKSVKELSEIFGRNKGAINSRIKKLELKEKHVG